MTKERLKQVAVRMSADLHKRTIRRAKIDRVSFGEFVRQAVSDKLEVLSRWRKI